MIYLLGWFTTLVAALKLLAMIPIELPSYTTAIMYLMVIGLLLGDLAFNFPSVTNSVYKLLRKDVPPNSVAITEVTPKVKKKTKVDLSKVRKDAVPKVNLWNHNHG